MRSDTVIRREHVKTAALHYMLHNQGFPTSVDIRNQMQAQGIEKGSKNLNVLKDDLKTVAEDLAGILVQREQLSVDGHNYEVPNSIFEMTLKFYQDVKAENQKEFEQNLVQYEEKYQHAEQIAADAVVQQKALLVENQQLQAQLEPLTLQSKALKEQLDSLTRTIQTQAKAQEVKAQELTQLQLDLKQSQAHQAQLQSVHQQEINNLNVFFEGQERKIAEQYSEEKKCNATLNQSNERLKHDLLLLKQERQLDQTKIRTLEPLKQVISELKNQLNDKDRAIASLEGALAYKEQLFESFKEMKQRMDLEGASKAIKSRKTVKKRLKRQTKENLRYTRRQLETRLKKGEVIKLVMKGDCIEFMLKDESRGYLITEQGTIRRFKHENKGWQVIEQIKAKYDQ